MKRIKSLATLADIRSYSKVNQFLNSKSRNSQRTEYIYGFALRHFQTFLKSEGYNIETILDAINDKKVNVYVLLDNFVSYLTLRQDPNNGNSGLRPSSIHNYIVGVRSYLEKNFIDISPSRFKNTVTVPKTPNEIIEPIDAKDITVIIQNCTNERLKVFLLVLASTGMRPQEILTLRNCDVDFSSNPAKVHIRAENSKTKQENYIYISNEASKELKRFIDSKYKTANKNPNHLIFSYENSTDSKKYLDLYRAIHFFFTKTLEKVDKANRRDGTGRRQINYVSFRSFVFTTAEKTISPAFAHWLLSHRNKDNYNYWNEKQEVKRQDYLNLMKYLTFLDYPTVEAVGKSFESQIEHLEEQIYEYQFNETHNNEAMKQMNEEIQELRNKLESSTKFIELATKELKKRRLESK